MPISILKGAKRKPLDYKFKGFDPTEIDSYQGLALPYFNAGEGSRKILFVLDWVPGEDLPDRKSRDNNQIKGNLLSGHQAELLENVVNKVAERYYLKKTVKFSWLAASFSAFRTVGKPRSFQDNAQHAFGKRIEFLIEQYKPDTVILFGQKPMAHFLAEEIEKSEGNNTPWIGVPITKKAGKHKTTFVSTLSLNTLATGQGGEASLLGYMGRNIANALDGKHRFAVDNERVNNHKSILIDTVAKFDKLMDKLEAHTGPVAVDTETANLNRIVNKLLTVQFAKCLDYGYVIPIAHKDTPFVADELAHIKKRLRRFFEGKNKNSRHVYTNGGFDFNQFRGQLGIRYIANRCYDIQAAEFQHDENLKVLKNVTGKGYYALANLAVQYGFFGYLGGDFSKKDRATIEARDLDKGLIRYCTMDVVVPLAIHFQQIAQAEFLGHKKFESQVADQISDMQHTFSRMENHGNLIDVEYLFYLKTPNSPIEKELNRLQSELLKAPAVTKANKALMKAKGISSMGWQGEVTVDMFNLNTPDHKRLLFFDILGLEPLSKGKSDKGKVDKVFQEHYKDVPEVAMFQGLGKAQKLRNSYVNSFIKLLGTSPDFNNDKRIRPQYQFLGVVTGRTSARDPNLQQVPARSVLGKQIKRLFIAEPGYLYIKVDYRVHEVRCWGLIAFDKALASVFQKAKDLRDEYRRKPYKELAKRLKTEADVHVINAAYFFSMKLEDVDKEKRNDVKAVVFGLIYQMAVKTLAKNLGKPLEFTENLVNNFKKRFTKAMKWNDDVKKQARTNFYVESPLGLRRHLWGYLLPKDNPNSGKVHGDMDRRAVNSPVQGMGAQFMAIGARQLDKTWWNILRKEKRDTGLKIQNSVHDSLENTSPYETFLENLGHVEQALTTKVREEVKRRHGFDFDVDLEIDFEIGASLSTCEGWDFSLLQLEDLVYESILFQKNELKHDISVKRAMRDVFIKGWDRAPAWLKTQAKNIDWQFDLDTIKKRREDSIAAAAQEKLEKEKKAAQEKIEKDKQSSLLAKAADKVKSLKGKAKKQKALR